MRAAKKIAARIAAIGIAILCIHLLVSSGTFAKLEEKAIDFILDRREKTTAAAAVTSAPTVTPIISAKPAATPAPSPAVKGKEPIETTIAGGMTIKNSTKYKIDVSGLLSAGPSIKFQADKPQILIIHTHSSEAYTPAGLDKYDSTDSKRTEDKKYSIIRVGDEIAKIFEGYGLKVLHDRQIYDYPSYTGSYTRSGAAIEKYLKDNPSIKIVIDLHRDALESGDVVYKTMAEEKGVCASQVMMLVGTDESGLKHPKWKENLKLALYLQSAVSKAHPTLMRPVELVPQRYNQHLTTGSLILEVGSSGNTLQEALAGVRLYADAAGPALAKLVE